MRYSGMQCNVLKINDLHCYLKFNHYATRKKTNSIISDKRELFTSNCISQIKI